MSEVEEIMDESWETESNSSLEGVVDRLLDYIKGFGAKYNREQGLSVVDLKHRGEAQGTRFRQLFVKSDNGMITVSLVESFKSAHGGNVQKETKGSFSVPVSAPEYIRLQERFFGYNTDKTIEKAKFLLDELETTLR